MRIKTIQLKHFKRFDDLTIDLGASPKKIIALVGPNGCGKSSIFDAFEETQKQFKEANRNPPPSFFGKLFYSILPGMKSTEYNRNDAIKITESTEMVFDKKSFYIRSPYRFTARLNIENIKSLPDLIADQNRPASSVDIDSRLQENYERLLGKAWNEYQYGTKSGPEMREELTGKINNILKNVVDIQISHLGDVLAKKGQLFFEKGSSKDFPYENLSSGEKEVVDIVIDLVVKMPEFNNTVYCIDEPELHLNTAIQRKLLIEIEKLIPDTCQLWVATHSIGFLRALQQDLKDKCSIIDFSDEDYFNAPCVIEPMITSRKNWQRIFQTALEDLTGLIAPKTIVYCEGKITNSLDEKIFNQIFNEYHDALFISATNKSEAISYAGVALTILNKAFTEVEIKVLVDRDDSEVNVPRISHVKVCTLERREFENYLFDKEIIMLAYPSVTSDEYDVICSDITNDDIKSKIKEFKKLCNENDEKELRLNLAKAITPQTETFQILKNIIFA